MQGDINNPETLYTEAEYAEMYNKWFEQSKQLRATIIDLHGEVERLEAENEKLIGLHIAHGTVIEYTDLDGNPVEYEGPKAIYGVPHD